MEKQLIEQGWAHDPCEGFLAHVGGLWEKSSEDERCFGFIAGDIHANRNGVVHGGMLLTFIDRAFGKTAREAAGAARSATISLTNNFTEPARIGSFIVVRPKVVRLTARLAFMEGAAVSGDTVLCTAQGVWRLGR